MKLKYSELNLKTKRALTSDFFKQHNITYETIDETTLDQLNDFLKTNPTTDRRNAFFEMIISETSLEKDLIKRYKKFVKSKVNTEIFFRLKYGDEKGIEKYKSYNAKRGFGNTLEGQIKKYGKRTWQKIMVLK